MLFVLFDPTPPGLTFGWFDATLMIKQDRSMNLRNLMLAPVLGVWVTQTALAQLPDAATEIYTLTSGSSLTDDCPICDRLPTVVPMTGTFRLRLLDQNPLFARYLLQDISFHAGAKGGAEYWLAGTGIFQAGGEVAVAQDIFLDLQIANGSATTEALCVNLDRSVTQPWPQIQVSVLQTNGTSAKVYSLILAAEPALQFRAIIPDYQKGDLRLEWESHGHQVQVERASSVEGPYAPISTITADQTFMDLGALTNRGLFYRLRQY